MTSYKKYIWSHFNNNLMVSTEICQVNNFLYAQVEVSHFSNITFYFVAYGIDQEENSSWFILCQVIHIWMEK